MHHARQRKIEPGSGHSNEWLGELARRAFDDRPSRIPAELQRRILLAAEPIMRSLRE